MSKKMDHQRIVKLANAAMKWWRSNRGVYFDPLGKATTPLHKLDRACSAYQKAKAAKK